MKIQLTKEQTEQFDEHYEKMEMPYTGAAVLIGLFLAVATMELLFAIVYHYIHAVTAIIFSGMALGLITWFKTSQPKLIPYEDTETNGDVNE